MMKKGRALSLYLFVILTLWAVVSFTLHSKAVYGAGLNQVTLQIEGMT